MSFCQWAQLKGTQLNWLQAGCILVMSMQKATDTRFVIFQLLHATDNLTPIQLQTDSNFGNIYGRF